MVASSSTLHFITDTICWKLWLSKGSWVKAASFEFDSPAVVNERIFHAFQESWHRAVAIPEGPDT